MLNVNNSKISEHLSQNIHFHSENFTLHIDYAREALKEFSYHIKKAHLNLIFVSEIGGNNESR